MKKILMTSAGSLVAQGILECLKQRRDELFLIGTNSQANAPVYSLDRAYLVPETTDVSKDFHQAFTEILTVEQPDLVIPTRDVDVVYLSKLKHDCELGNSEFPVGDLGVAVALEDKLGSYRLSQTNDLPFALTVDKADQLNDIQWPIVVKPRKGFASKGVSIVTNMNQLESCLNADMIAQEYLGERESVFEYMARYDEYGLPLFHSFESEKWALQLYIGKDKSLLYSVASVHNMKSGISQGVEIIESTETETLINKYHSVFAELGWRGPLNVQMQRTPEGNLKAYEYNGRFTGATSARYFLGVDEIGVALTDLIDLTVSPDGRYASQESVTKQPTVSVVPSRAKDKLVQKQAWDKIDDS